MLLCALRKISVFRQTCKKSEETCRPAGLLRLLLLHYDPQRLTHRAADHAAQHSLDHSLKEAGLMDNAEYEQRKQKLFKGQ